MLQEDSDESAKAVRCYQAALKLDPVNEAAGTALADYYVARGDMQSANLVYDRVILNDTDGAQSGVCGADIVRHMI